jgi:hypothetical protein
LLHFSAKLSTTSFRQLVKDFEMDGMQSVYEPETTSRRYGSITPRHANVTEAQIALSHGMMNTVFSLRYHSYVSQNFIDPCANELFSDEFDTRSNSVSILIYRDGVPAASVRASLYDPSGLIPGAETIPALDAFGAEIDDLITSYRTDGRPARALEITRLVRRPDLANDNDLVFAMYRMTYYLVVHYEADMILSAVRQNHMPFYRRFGFQKVTEPRIYPKLKFLAGLMACFGTNYGSVKQTVPIFQHVSKHDSICAPFMLGERIKVFSEMHQAGAALATHQLL